MVDEVKKMVMDKATELQIISEMRSDICFDFCMMLAGEMVEIFEARLKDSLKDK